MHVRNRPGSVPSGVLRGACITAEIPPYSLRMTALGDDRTIEKRKLVVITGYSICRSRRD